MKKTKLFFINGIILTVTSFIMKCISMIFSIYISNQIGSEAVGIFSLLMSVYIFAITLSTSGFGIACTCIVSEELSNKNSQNGLKTVKSCLFFALFLSISISIIMMCLSNIISEKWLNSSISSIPFVLMSIALPFISVSNVLNGYFSAVRKSFKAAFSQVFELIVKILITVLLFKFNHDNSVESVCIFLILADVLSEICSCCLLMLLYKLDISKYYNNINSNHSFTHRIIKIAFPIFVTSFVRSGLSTLKQFIIPKQLVIFGLSYTIALSEYGKINGMTMSILLFPQVFIMSFSNLLIPEFASLAAHKYKKRILEICKKIFFVTSIFSVSVAFFFFLFANQISNLIFTSSDCSLYIKILAPLVLFIYPDIILDSILKGLNSQFHVMICNILDLVLTIILLYLFLPILGITGYLLVIAVSEFFNFCLSYLQLYKTTGFKIPVVLICCYLISLLFFLIV